MNATLTMLRSYVPLSRAARTALALVGISLVAAITFLEADGGFALACTVISIVVGVQTRRLCAPEVTTLIPGFTAGTSAAALLLVGAGVSVAAAIALPFGLTPAHVLPMLAFSLLVLLFMVLEGKDDGTTLPILLGVLWLPGVVGEWLPFQLESLTGQVASAGVAAALGWGVVRANQWRNFSVGVFTRWTRRSGIDFDFWKVRSWSWQILLGAPLIATAVGFGLFLVLFDNAGSARLFTLLIPAAIILAPTWLCILERKHLADWWMEGRDKDRAALGHRVALRGIFAGVCAAALYALLGCIATMGLNMLVLNDAAIALALGWILLGIRSRMLPLLDREGLETVFLLAGLPLAALTMYSVSSIEPLAMGFLPAVLGFAAVWATMQTSRAFARLDFV